MYILGLVAVALVVVLILVALGMGGRDQGEQGDPEGPWNDLKGFKETVSSIEGTRYYEAESPLDLNDVTDHRNTLYYLLGIERELTVEEIQAIRDFVIAGGKVVVADDGTLANDLGHIPKESAGGTVRYEGHRYLVQGKTGDPDPGFITNRSFIRSTSNIGGVIYGLVSHEPMGLNYTGNGFVWLKTTKVLTVIDLNDNYVQELTDKYSPYGTIAVGYNVGTNGGSIVYFSTTGVFTDNVIRLGNNKAFLRDLSRVLLPEGGDLILDQSKEVRSTSPHRTILPEG
jgi:hypothetical protein